MRRGAERADDLGVSPVIGMIMILAISVTGIAAVIAWGLPAIDEMKASVETRAVTNQFKELDHDVKQLISGTADRTAKRWQPSLSRGSIDFQEGAERWMIGYATCAAVTASCDDQVASVLQEYGWALQQISDADHGFILRNNGPNAVTVKVTANVIENGEPNTRWVNQDANTAPTGAMTAGVSIASGGTATFYVWKTDGVTKQFIDSDYLSGGGGTTLELVLTDTVLTETAGAFYIFDSGQARFRLDTTGSAKGVYLTNGAVIVANGPNEVVDNVPGIPAPKEVANSWQFFVRGSALQGHASFGGEDRFDVLLTLYGTNTLVNEDAVGEVYVYVGGDHQTAWNAHLSDANGYSFTADVNGDASMTALKQRIDESGVYQSIAFTYVHSVVRVDY